MTLGLAVYMLASIAGVAELIAAMAHAGQDRRVRRAMAIGIVLSAAWLAIEARAG